MEVKETDLVCKLALPPEFGTETLKILGVLLLHYIYMKLKSNTDTPLEL